jgi:hypothetical protein
VHETKVYFTGVSPKGPALERFPNIKIKNTKKKKAPKFYCNEENDMVIGA